MTLGLVAAVASLLAALLWRGLTSGSQMNALTIAGLLITMSTILRPLAVALGIAVARR